MSTTTKLQHRRTRRAYANPQHGLRAGKSTSLWKDWRICSVYFRADHQRLLHVRAAVEIANTHTYRRIWWIESQYDELWLARSPIIVSHIHVFSVPQPNPPLTEEHFIYDPSEFGIRSALDQQVTKTLQAPVWNENFFVGSSSMLVPRGSINNLNLHIPITQIKILNLRYTRKQKEKVTQRAS